MIRKLAARVIPKARIDAVRTHSKRERSAAAVEYPVEPPRVGATQGLASVTQTRFTHESSQQRQLGSRQIEVAAHQQGSLLRPGGQRLEQLLQLRCTRLDVVRLRPRVQMHI